MAERYQQFLNSIFIGKEEFYNVMEMIACLDKLSDVSFDIANIVVTPFYIETNRKYEIYHKEFTYDASIEVLEMSEAHILMQYFFGLLECDEIQTEIQSVFSTFEPKNLYFAVYGDLYQSKIEGFSS